VRGRAFVRRRTLVRRLAQGAEPSCDAELRCCAERLSSRRGRLGLAVGLERLLEAAEEPRTPLTSAVPLNRREILEHESRLLGLVAELSSRERLGVRGLALLERMLPDSESPFYAAAEPLAAALDRAHEALLRG
jgi:hypothetical protein